MIRRLGLIVLILSLMAGCSPKMPDALRAQMSEVLQEGSTLTAMTDQGVNYLGFSDQLAKTRGAYNLALSMWPERFAPEARADFDRAFQGWDLTRYLWGLKIDEADNPVEPDINKYLELVAFAEEDLLFDVHPSNFIVAKYRGKKYLPFENIGVLMSVSSDSFTAGQTLILEKMK